MSEIVDGPADERWAAARKRRHKAFVDAGKAKLREVLSKQKRGAPSFEDLEILMEVLLDHIVEGPAPEAEEPPAADEKPAEGEKPAEQKAAE